MLHINSIGNVISTNPIQYISQHPLEKNTQHIKNNNESDEFILDEILINTVQIDSNKLISNMNNLLEDFYGNSSLSLFPKKKEKEIVNNDYNLCPLCKIPGKINDAIIICEKCGMERAWDLHTNDTYNMSIDQNYNTMNNSFMTFSIVGQNSYNLNRSLLKTCADYSLYRHNNNKKEIINRIYRYEGSKPPMNIVNQTADLFDKIKNKGYVYRGDGKLGVIAACLYYVSIENNLTRTPKEIAAIMQIEDKFLSQGDRILQELNELGVISIQTTHKPLNDYLNTYLPKLKIPDKYRGFIVDIISRAEKKHLHIRNESRLTTKIVGVIYLLTQRVPELKDIKKNTISEECNNISKATYTRYYTLICSEYKIMKKCFRKHKIPMPVEWKK
jgi:hypothetical protein